MLYGLLDFSLEQSLRLHEHQFDGLVFSFGYSFQVIGHFLDSTSSMAIHRANHFCHVLSIYLQLWTQALQMVLI
jgi:hypothetical protein